MNTNNKFITEDNWSKNRQNSFQLFEFIMSVTSFIIDDYYKAQSNNTQINLIKTLARKLAEINYRWCMQFAESDMEKSFLLQIISGFCKTNPFSLIVYPGDINDFISIKDRMCKDEQVITNTSQTQKELIIEMANKILSQKDFDYYLFCEFIRELGCLNTIYMFPGASFGKYITLETPANKVKNIKADILFTNLIEGKYKLIIDCNGYERCNYRNQTKFVNYRKRNKLLKACGYEICRFSSAEILYAPISCVTELHNYIFQK